MRPRKASTLVLSILLLSFVLGFATRASAEESAPRHRVALAGGFDGTLRPDLGGHGYALLAYDLERLPRGSHLSLSFNTDTARIRFDRLRLSGSWLEGGAHAAYEFIFAGLLTDYFRDGRREVARGFGAGYFIFGAFLKALLPRDHYIEVALDVRRWSFDTMEGTDPGLTLPLESWVIEPRLRYTFWRLQDDPSIREAHRPFMRVQGVAFGFEIGADFRTEAAAFGAIDPDHFSPIDPRNQGEATVLMFRQWLRAGVQAHDRVRFQFLQVAATGRGEDDLTRMRIGGSNPYVVPLAGAPWASLLADLLVAVEVSLHVRIWRELEVGLVADGIALRDLHRVGDRDLDFAGGLGVFADLRFGAFQIDLRGGWTPSLGVDLLGHWNIFAAFGWQWSR